MEKLLSLKAVAEATSLSVVFWRRAIRDGRIAAVKVGHSVRIRQADLEAVSRIGMPSRVGAHPGTRRTA